MKTVSKVSRIYIVRVHAWHITGMDGQVAGIKIDCCLVLVTLPWQWLTLPVCPCPNTPSRLDGTYSTNGFVLHPWPIKCIEKKLIMVVGISPFLVWFVGSTTLLAASVLRWLNRMWYAYTKSTWTFCLCMALYILMYMYIRVQVISLIPRSFQCCTLRKLKS